MDFKTNYCSVQTLFSYGKHKQLYLCQDLARSQRGVDHPSFYSLAVSTLTKERGGSGDIRASEFRFHRKLKRNLGFETELPVSTYPLKMNSPGTRIEEKSQITIKQLYASIILV